MKKNNTSQQRRHFMQASIAGAALLGLGVPASLWAQDQRLARPGATVKTTDGSVRGLVREDIQQFWDLPYGASTTGANRFMPPQKPASWTGVRDHFQITYAAPMEPGGAEPSPVVTALNRDQRDVHANQ